MMYSLLAIVLMAMDQRGHYVPRFRSTAEYLVEPVYHVVEWPVRALRNLFGQFQSRRSLRKENEALQQLLLNQQGALQRLQTLVEENRRLRALIEGAEGQAFEFQFAELIRVDLDPFSHKVVIDRGSVDGVQPGQAVIDGAGVMGQIEDVHPHFSSLRLISDPNHALPVQISRTGLRTVAFGSGETGSLHLPSIPRQADVRKGDLVVTSGLGDRFPSGYPVASIEEVSRQEGQTFAQIEARPLAALDRGREVLLISTVMSQTEAELPEDAGETMVEGAESGEIPAPADSAVSGAEVATEGAEG
jgi:rod shape-determining protein MreC